MHAPTAASTEDRGERAGEHHRREQVAREDDDLRPEDRGEDAAGQHEGDGARLEFGRRVVGGGEAELLHEGAAEPDHQQAEREQPEARPGTAPASRPAPPSAVTTVPVMKPLRWPSRRMMAAAGKAPSATPTLKPVTGAVASDLSAPSR